jgi:hypothetical protein
MSPGFSADAPAKLKRLDRSFQTDARAEPARPDDGTASGASDVFDPLDEWYVAGLLS